VLFAFLADIDEDPYYGLRLNYEGREGSRCSYVAVLIASDSKSTTASVGEGYKVTTLNIKDVANPHGESTHTAVGYCTLDTLSGFRLDPPRGKTMRCALCLLTKKDVEGLHIHKLEYIEPDQVAHAVACMQKLRKLCSKIHPESQEKRSHAVAFCSGAQPSPDAKKAKTLRSVPTDADLADEPGLDLAGGSEDDAS
jgi:hypothetical protein